MAEAIPRPCKKCLEIFFLTEILEICLEWYFCKLAPILNQRCMRYTKKIIKSKKSLGRSKVRPNCLRNVQNDWMATELKHNKNIQNHKFTIFIEFSFFVTKRFDRGLSDAGAFASQGCGYQYEPACSWVAKQLSQWLCWEWNLVTKFVCWRAGKCSKG